MKRTLDPRLAAVLAVALVAGALGAILAFGRLHHPAFPSLREQPDTSITGSIAYLRWDHGGDDGAPCVWVLPASGERAPRKLHCEADISTPLTWSPAGLEVWKHGGPKPAVVVLDPGDGRVLRRDELDGGPPGPPDGAMGPDGMRASTESRDGRVRLWVDDGVDRRLVATVDGPRDYGWWSTVWSPDGRHIAVQDSAERLLLVRVADGRIRLLAEDVGELSWGP